MLPQESWMDIKALKAQGHSQRAVAKLLGLHRDTVRRVWNEGQPRRYRRRPGPTKLDGFREHLQSRLGSHPGLCATRLYREIRERGFAGGYEIVKRWCRGFRREERARQGTVQTALIGVQTPFGDQGYVLLVNVANLGEPQFAGRIQDPERPIGGKLAFDSAGLLYSSARATTGGESVLGGVKTATFKVLAAVTSARPTLVRALDLPGQPAQETTLSDLPFSFAVFPQNYKATAPLFEVRTTNGQSVVSQAVQLANGLGSYTMPKGLVKNASDNLLAVFSFDVAGKRIVSGPRFVDLVHATLTVDSNNDTVVNDADDIAVRTDPNKDDSQKALAFGFWDGGSDLVDYARLRLTLDRATAKDERIGLRLSGSDWTLEKKLRPDELGPLTSVPDGCAAEGKLHLCHAEAALRQAQRNAEGGAEAPVPLGNGVIEIPRVLLRNGANEFLFRCNPRADGTPACPAPKLELVRIEDTEREVVDERRVDIRPLQQWITVYNARSDPSEGRPDGAFSPSPPCQ